MNTHLEIPEFLVSFVANSTKEFDESHNLEHALKVTHASHTIMETIDENYDKKLITFTAMLHDVCDHKYPCSITEDELIRFIAPHFTAEKSAAIMDVIHNMSFSKQVKGIAIVLAHPYNDYLIAVSDADKLEAIGQVGIDRCTEYALTHGGVVPADVVTHCHEKLLRLLPENFIKSVKGRELAEPLHNEIVEYVRKHE